MRYLALLLIAMTLGCRGVAQPPDSVARLSRFDNQRQKASDGIEQVAFIQEIQSTESSHDQTPDVEKNDSETGERRPESTPSSRRVETEAQGDGSTATLEDMLAIAWNINPAIQQLQAEIEALKGRHCQTGLLPNPTFGFNGQDINEAGSPGRYGVYYENRIVRGNKLRLSQQVVCREIRQAEMELSELRERLATDVKLRYFGVLVATKKQNLAERLVKLSRDAVEATSQLLEAKEIAQTALIQAELELQNALVQEQRASNELLASRNKLAVLLGEMELPFTSLAGSLDEPNELDIESEFDQILQTSPEIARLDAGVNVARGELLRQCVEPIGDVAWQTGVAYDFASDDLVAGFQVGVLIPRCDQNQGAICEAQNQIVAAERRVETRALELRQRLVETYQAYRDAKIQIESYEAKILPRAQESLELIVEGFQQGEEDFLQLLTAQRTFFQFNLAFIEQQSILWQARIRIEGLLLEGSLDDR